MRSPVARFAGTTANIRDDPQGASAVRLWLHGDRLRMRRKRVNNTCIRPAIRRYLCSNDAASAYQSPHQSISNCSSSAGLRCSVVLAAVCNAVMR